MSKKKRPVATAIVAVAITGGLVAAGWAAFGAFVIIRDTFFEPDPYGRDETDEAGA